MDEYEEYISKDGQIETQAEWEGAGKPVAGSQKEKAWVGSQEQKNWQANQARILGAKNLPTTAQQMIPNELYYDAPTKTWYGIGPENKPYPVDPTLGEMKYAAYRAKYQPTKPFELTIPGKPAVPPWTPGAVPPWPGENVPEEEFPYYGEEFQSWLRQIGKGKPGTPATTIPSRNLITRSDGSQYYIDDNGRTQEVTPAKVTAQPPPYGRERYWGDDGYEYVWVTDPGTGKGSYIRGGYDKSRITSQGLTEYQKRELELREKAGETETTRLSYERGRDIAAAAAEKERRLAELAARPINWLQYAAETKTPPVVQPWMMPLSQEQYGWKVGEPIPGVSWATRAQTVGQEPQFFSEEERQRYANAPTTPAPAGQDWRFFAGQWQLRNKEGAMAGSETLPTTATGMNFQNLPELLRPGAQLWARMGPTAQQQLYGYQQAQSGISPEESEFRRQSTLPPGGRAPRWVWSR